MQTILGTPGEQTSGQPLYFPRAPNIGRTVPERELVATFLQLGSAPTLQASTVISETTVCHFPRDHPSDSEDFILEKHYLVPGICYSICFRVLGMVVDMK